MRFGNDCCHRRFKLLKLLLVNFVNIWTRHALSHYLSPCLRGGQMQRPVTTETRKKCGSQRVKECRLSRPSVRLPGTDYGVTAETAGPNSNRPRSVRQGEVVAGVESQILSRIRCNLNGTA